MRLKKGDRVEVMNKNEVPASWRVAEILSGNGHTYRVKHVPCHGKASELKVETVSRKFVRPCQPLVQGVENYICGDVIEVLHDCAWRTATILRVHEDNREIKSKKICLQAAAVQTQYLVRLFGCSQELIVNDSTIRTKEMLHDDKWIVCGESSRAGGDATANKPSTSTCYQQMNFQIPLFNARAKMQPEKDSGSLKRRKSTHDFSINEAHNGRTQKLRAIEKDGRKWRLVAAPVLEKVDAVAYPGEILGDKNMHTSFKFISPGYNQMERGKPNDGLSCRVIRNSQLNSSDSDASSVGSCSVTDQSPDILDIPSVPLRCQETDTVCSDAESCYGSGSERKSSSPPPEEEIELRIRRLELHAYRRTLEALHASGPLSWEQESMLTNLRTMLHISNDDHLMEMLSDGK